MANKTFSKILGIEPWLQTDDKWRWIGTSCGSNIGVEGCVITSVAMIFKKFGDNVDPKILTERLKSTHSDCPFDWDYASRVYKHPYKGKKSGKFDTFKGEMLDLIYNKGVPLMVRVPNHTVVISGFVGTLPVYDRDFPDLTQIKANMFLVNDPGKAKNVTLQDVIDQRGDFEYFNYYEK